MNEELVIDIGANLVYYKTILVTLIIRQSVLMVLARKSWFFLHNYVIYLHHKVMLRLERIFCVEGK